MPLGRETAFDIGNSLSLTMRIGVDACCWSNKRGFGRFTRELLAALIEVDTQNEYLFFADGQTAATCTFPSEAALVPARTDRAATDAASSSGRRSFRDVWALTRTVLAQDLDLFFFPAVYSYYPILNRVKIVLTIHDVIADHHPGETFPNWKLKYFWKLKQRVALFQTDQLLTVSKYSKRSIGDYFGVPAPRISVITEGPHAAFEPLPDGDLMNEVLTRHGLEADERFLLYVGGISPHKNLGTLVEAFHDLIKDEGQADLKLVLVGDYADDAFHSDYPRLKAQIEAFDLEERVHFTGFVPDKDLAYLYNAASLLCFPSLEEGFGLPAVEAMACGTPVVASNRGSLPEIVGDAGRLFDPTSPRELQTVLKKVLSRPSLQDEMQQRGLARAEQFTWERAAEQTIDVFEELI